MMNNRMTKKAIAVSMLAAFLLLLVGCSQPVQEQSSMDALTEYRDNKCIAKFLEESGDDISIMQEAAEKGGFESAVDTNAIIYVMCKDVAELKDIPEKCEELHESYKKAAEELMEASDHYLDAALSQDLNDVVGATNNMKKGTECVKRSIEHIEECNRIVDRIKGEADLEAIETLKNKDKDFRSSSS